jgi:hypothetical protein
VKDAAETSRNSVQDIPVGPLVDEGDDEGDSRSPARYPLIHKWASANRPLLHLAPEPIEVSGVHSSFRVAQDGQLLVETVIQFTQNRAVKHDLGGVPFRGGTTMVTKANGAIQYVISKPLPTATLPAQKNNEANARLEGQAGYVALVDEMDSYHIWQDKKFQARRIADRITLAALDRSGW